MDTPEISGTVVNEPPPAEPKKEKTPEELLTDWINEKKISPDDAIAMQHALSLYYKHNIRPRYIGLKV